ncbi:hypothetical protein ABIB00_007699 [Bradyrhizobium sp. LB14.3]|uniref:phage head-tail connector protein n=1 Tax=Bradyrhizobium sp. LB14.3 TaxID=3156328 RepID=UPI0033967A67
MRSIVTVASPASDTALTTLERVKLELGIPSGTTTSDPILQEKIEEASDDIEAALGFRLVRETAVETFWHEQYDVAPEKLVLDRTPVAAIASVVVDGLRSTPRPIGSIRTRVSCLRSATVIPASECFAGASS